MVEAMTENVLRAAGKACCRGKKKSLVIPRSGGCVEGQDLWCMHAAGR
jgi:hypothetical protein